MSTIGDLSNFPKIDTGSIHSDEDSNSDLPITLAELDQNRISHGSISFFGRNRSMMESMITMVAGEVAFFAVHEGHGGRAIANDCLNWSHYFLSKDIKSQKSSEEGVAGGSSACKLGKEEEELWKKVRDECFAKMEQVDISSSSGSSNSSSNIGNGTVKTGGGSAAVVMVTVMVGKEKLVVASYGASRVVLCRDGVAVPLSRDHQFDWPNQVHSTSKSTVAFRMRRNSGGDHLMEMKQNESDEFLIIASGGLWDHVSTELACEVARKCLKFSGGEENRAPETAISLAKLALAKGSKHNISIIVVQLKKK